MRRRGLAVFCLAAAAVVAAAGCASASLKLSPPNELVRPEAPKDGSYRFAVVGDTQQMEPIDWILRGGPRERAQVRERIEALRPDFVLHAGDIVGNGGSVGQWEGFRREYSRVPLWPVLGNHDLFGGGNGALAHYFETFPHVEKRRYYALRFAPIVFLMLDSNLDDDGWKAQSAWLEGELDRAEKDPLVRAIVLVTHHPPLSVQVGGGSARVRSDLYDAAARRSKFLLYLCGHHHAYQHIEEGGRHVFVTGGGGAPLLLLPFTKLRKGEKLVRSHTNHHFLEVRVTADGLTVAVHELARKGWRREWAVAEEIAIPWPGGARKLF